MCEILKNFWVLEGLDGSGTTTQLKNLKKELEKRNIKHFITCEPTNEETGKLIRMALKGDFKVSQSTLSYMFAADRDNHINNKENGIRKHIKDGEVVISDRYHFSSIAYQSVNYDRSCVIDLNKNFPFPEFLIYIDTPVKTCIERINARGQDKEIFEKLSFQKKVQEGYEYCINNLPKGCNLIKVDGTLPIEKITQTIVEKLGLCALSLTK